MYIFYEIFEALLIYQGLFVGFFCLIYQRINQEYFYYLFSVLRNWYRRFKISQPLPVQQGIIWEGALLKAEYGRSPLPNKHFVSLQIIYNAVLHLQIPAASRARAWNLAVFTCSMIGLSTSLGSVADVIDYIRSSPRNYRFVTMAACTGVPAEFDG